MGGEPPLVLQTSGAQGVTFFKFEREVSEDSSNLLSVSEIFYNTNRFA